MIANIDPLVGRRFVTSAGNIGRVERMGLGGVRVNWTHRPTQQDLDECLDRVQGVIGKAEVAGGEFANRQAEEEAYRAWRRDAESDGEEDPE